MSRPILRPIWTPQDAVDTAIQFGLELANAERGAAGSAECPHDSYSGDEGPIVELGRWPLRWRCDGCGHIRYDNPERGHRHCTRCDLSQLVVRIDPDGVCRNCKRRSVRERIAGRLFARSRERRARRMDAFAVALLMVVSAMLGCLALLAANPAKADINDPDVIAYTALFGGVVCDVLDAHPSIPGVLGVAHGIQEDSGFTAFQAGEVIGLAVVEICPRHVGLIQRFAAVAGSGAWT